MTEVQLQATGARAAAPPVVRTLGVDVGERRIGLALSDPSGTLATPLDTLAPAGGLDARVAAVAGVVGRLAREEDGLAAVVVGWPLALDGSPHAQTARVEAFVAALRRRIALPVRLQDERLTSREAEGRLALREKNWRRRRGRLDAAAAAVILQEHLDAVQSSMTGLRRRRMMVRRLLLFAGVLAVAAPFAAALAVHELGRQLEAPYRGYAAAEVFVAIDSGDTTRTISRRLANAGGSTRRTYLPRRRLVGRPGDARCRPAKYRFDRALSPMEVVDVIATGRGPPAAHHVSGRADHRRDGGHLRVRRVRLAGRVRGGGAGGRAHRRSGPRGDRPRGLPVSRHLRAAAGRHRRRPRAGDGGAVPPRVRPRHPRRSRPPRPERARGGDAGVARREGDRQHGRARAGVGGVRQPPAHRHAAAVRPDRDLRPPPRGPVRRQPDARQPAPRLAVQHLRPRRAAARTNCRPGSRRPGRRRRPPPT